MDADEQMTESNFKANNIDIVAARREIQNSIGCSVCLDPAQ